MLLTIIFPFSIIFPKEGFVVASPAFPLYLSPLPSQVQKKWVRGAVLFGESFGALLRAGIPENGKHFPVLQ